MKKIIVIILAVIVSGYVLTNSAKTQAESVKDFRKAAIQNARLQYSLKWYFGKPQRGWFLYVPLIQHTLKIKDGANTPEFAFEVSKWQRKQRIKSDGVIGTKTLFSFIKVWQSKRLRPIYEANENQLLTAPIKDFYDPTRDIALLKVDKNAYRAYKKMLAAAIADESLNLKTKDGKLLNEEKFLKFISTYRSPAYQRMLRKREKGATRVQIARKSPHFTGRALDIYVGGKPVSTKDYNRAIQIKTPVYKWLVKNAEKFGFYNYFYEPWHWEYVG